MGPFDYTEAKPSCAVTAQGAYPESRWIKLGYSGWNNDQVPALLIEPNAAKRSHPAPCLLVIHGLGGRKEIMLPVARLAAQDGYASLIIDLPGFGERASTMPAQFKDDKALTDFIHQQMQQSVIDLRRGIDLLDTRPEIDSQKIALIGLSLGGFIGADLAGVDKRVKVAMLIAAGGSFDHILPYQAKLGTSYGKPYAALILSMAPAELESRLEDVDPITWIGSISPRPLLMMNGEKDTVVPPDSAKLLYAAARQPKQIQWFAGEGHVPNPYGLFASLSIFLRKNMPPE